VCLHAEVILEQVKALSIVETRVRSASTNVIFTPVTRPTSRAVANKSVDGIRARPAIEARVGSALVNVGLAHLANETRAALALEHVVQVDALFRANRVARVRLALVNLGLALQANVAGTALASEALDFVDARAAVLARCIRAVVNQVLASIKME
jgi:hypothetical protein